MEEIAWSKAEDFVKAYLEGVKKAIDSIEGIKTGMQEAGVDAESIGYITEYTDVFSDHLLVRFGEAMSRLLMGSGYTTNKALRTPAPKNKPAVFV
jgi:hypothetical protein